ncbi:hypothetical protein Avbf_02638, partial [Armadillidium vulgare]
VAEQKEKQQSEVTETKVSYNNFEIRNEKPCIDDVTRHASRIDDVTRHGSRIDDVTRHASRIDDVTRHASPEASILKSSALHSSRHPIVDSRNVPLESRHNSLDNRYHSMDRRKSYQLESIGGSSTLHSSSGDIITRVQTDTLQVRFEDDYLSTRSQSHTNISFPMEELGKRNSTQTSILPASPQKYSDNIPSGYSSLRRTPHSYTVQPRATHHLPPQHSPGMGGNPNLSLSKSPLISNGSALSYSTPKRSPYSPTPTSWSPTPLPPPYQRNSIPNGRAVGLCESPRPASRITNSLNRNISTSKVHYAPGSKVVSGATYL